MAPALAVALSCSGGDECVLEPNVIYFAVPNKQKNDGLIYASIRSCLLNNGVTYALNDGCVLMSSDPAGEPQATAFRDAGMSLRTTLQLFVGVDFSAVVQNTVDEVGPAAMLFFVAYHVVGVLIVFNLLTAIMIQLYG